MKRGKVTYQQFASGPLTARERLYVQLLAQAAALIAATPNPGPRMREWCDHVQTVLLAEEKTAWGDRP